MPKEPPNKARHKLTDAERYKQFLDAAKEAGASDDPKDFDRAFKKVTSPSSASRATSTRHHQDRDQNS